MLDLWTLGNAGEQWKRRDRGEGTDIVGGLSLARGLRDLEQRGESGNARGKMRRV